ncbi:MAG: 30S ribosome-binding factor RbfA [Planctomycetia bacterium]
MASRRPERVAEAVREVVSTVVLFELKDPRVENVTVLRAEVSGDLRNAKVYVSIMGDERKQSRVLHGLDSSRGFLQRKMAERLEMRYTPVLTFILDDSVKRSLRMSALLSSVLPNEAAVDPDAVDPDHETVDDEAVDAMESDADDDGPAAAASEEASPNAGDPALGDASSPVKE